MGPSRQSRAFSGVIYPESAPSDYLRILREMHVPVAWALHDRDVDDDGNLKKAHIHVLFYFPGKKTLRTVRELLRPLGSDLVDFCESLGTMTRYLMHLDNPEKVQYPRDVVETAGGFPLEELLVPVGNPGPEIRRFIRDQGIFFYSTIQTYCDQERPDWGEWVEKHPAHLIGFLKAFREEHQHR